MTTIHPATSTLPRSHSIHQVETSSFSSTCYEVAKQSLKNSAALTAGAALGACIGLATGLPLIATITITACAALGIATFCSCASAVTPSPKSALPATSEKTKHRTSSSRSKSGKKASIPRPLPVPPLQIPSPQPSPRLDSARSSEKSSAEPVHTPTATEQEPPTLSASVIPLFPQPQQIVEFSQQESLPITAAELTIQDVAQQAPLQAASSSAPSDTEAANLDMTLALLSHYERWMKKIASADFSITLPPPYVLAKMNDFLTVYGDNLKECAATHSTEQFQYYVLNPIYDRLHSPENRRQFVEECFQLQRAEEVKQSPSSYLERQLGYDLPPKQAAEAVQQIQHELGQLTPETSIRDIEMLKEQLHATLNARALDTLKQDLHAEFGENGNDFVEAIMNDWAFIGTDIKYNLSFLTPERIDNIKEKARIAFSYSEELNAQIDRLRSDLAQGLPADDALVSAKYTTLEELQKHTPLAKKQQVRAEITKALAIQELKNKSRYQGTSIERSVLKALGYSLKQDNDRSELQESMGAFLATLGQNQEAWTKSSRRLKQEIADYAFETRLTLAGVPRERHPYIAGLIKWAKAIYTEWNERALALQQESMPEIDVLERLPKARKRFLQKIQVRTRSALKRRIIRSINELKELKLIRPQKPSKESLEALIQPSSRITSKISNEINWLQRYQHTFVQEFSQGDNLQEALLDGVCFGKTCGLAQGVLENPDATWKELKPGRISPQDRFFQAAYAHHFSKTKNYPADDVRRHSVPDTLKHMKGVTLKPVCQMIHPTKKALYEQLMAKLPEIQKSNGGLIVTACNHATFMRIDVSRNIFEFTDPNFGYQKFSLDPSKQTPEAVIMQMATCAIELIEQVYEISKTDPPAIFVAQLVKKSESKKISNSFYKYPIVDCRGKTK